MAKVHTSRVFKAIRNSTEKILMLQGSTRSTKTYSIIQYLISLALENEKIPKKKRKKLRFIVIRQKLTWLKTSVIKDYEEIMTEQFEMYDENNMNKTDWIYTLGSTEISFTGLDHAQGQKFHGVGYDVVWFNEANEIDYPSVRQILLRLKGRAIFDYNPNIDKNHWLIKKIKSREDVFYNHSTYKDNPFLEQSIIDEIEGYEPTPENIERGTADEDFWKIYGLGLRSLLKGLVFPNINIVKTIPKFEDNVPRFGLDFGFTNDPTAMVELVINGKDLYINERIYEKGLTNIDNPKMPSQPSIERRFEENNITARDKIYADSAEPKSIKDLKNCGYDIVGIQKGAGSIQAGIMTIKNYRINITEESENVINEFQKYIYKQNPETEESTNIPIDKFNHAIDATRYGLIEIECAAQKGNYNYDSVSQSINLSKYGG